MNTFPVYFSTGLKIEKRYIVPVILRQIIALMRVLETFGIPSNSYICHDIAALISRSKYTMGRKILRGIRALKSPRGEIFHEMTRKWTPIASQWKGLKDDVKMRSEMDDIYYNSWKSAREWSCGRWTFLEYTRNREYALEDCVSFLKLKGEEEEAAAAEAAAAEAAAAEAAEEEDREAFSDKRNRGQKFVGKKTLAWRPDKGSKRGGKSCKGRKGGKGRK